MKFSEFKKQAEQKVSKLAEIFESMPWENRDFYNHWLTQTHAYVSYTSTFLTLCNQMTPKGHPLKEHFEHHLEEEDGHEKMSENDMKFMNSPDLPVFGITGVFWKSQFYWIKEHGPTAHLGYSLLLEGLAAVSGHNVLKRIQGAGFNGYTFLKVHAEEDTGHFNRAVEATSVLSDAERSNIYQNLCEGMDTYVAILKECERRSVSRLAA
nr:hypothetical protein BdHM001_36570 [Bdellovibrio sp. HM001]